MIKCTFQADLQSVANNREHWAKKYRREKKQSESLLFYLKPYVGLISLPCQVILTRISPRKLDDDNLVSAFKHIRDTVADVLIPGKKRGRADDSKLIQWQYAQEKPEPKARVKKQIKVEIMPLAA